MIIIIITIRVCDIMVMPLRDDVYKITATIILTRRRLLVHLLFLYNNIILRIQSKLYCNNTFLYFYCIHVYIRMAVTNRGNSSPKTASALTTRVYLYINLFILLRITIHYGTVKYCNTLHTHTRKHNNNNNIINNL